MDLPFEAAKGASEKILMVRFPVLMRVILPGLLATGVFYPTTIWILRQFPSNAESSWQRIAAYAALIFVLGALISTLGGEIYKIYEGRTFWPARLLEWGRNRQQARIRKLRRAADEAKTTAAYNEAWYQLRVYPMNAEGDLEATHPTILGNILAGYEQYPQDRYGMDSIFFWTRIWLDMDKDKKEEIDSQWSVADGFLTLSAISVAGGVLWIVESLVASLGFVSFRAPVSTVGMGLLAGAGWMLLAYAWYRLSLPFHRENGEVYKSIFDLYRSKVWDLTSLRPLERDIWYATWAYLQYRLLKCPNCGKWTAAGEESCESCGFGLKELNDTWSKTGKFPI